MIAVADVQATSRWYQQVLGLASGHGGPAYEQLMAGDALVLQLHAWDAEEHGQLGDPARKPYGNGVLLWFHEANVARAYERALERGAEVVEPLHVNPLAHHLEFSLRDPNGYIVRRVGRARRSRLKPPPSCVPRPGGSGPARRPALQRVPRNHASAPFAAWRPVANEAVSR